MPAHVTVLFPFLSPQRIDESALAALCRAVASVAAFDVMLPRVGWFGTDVLWLAPEPPQPFRALTAAVWREFPAIRRTAVSTTTPSRT